MGRYKLQSDVIRLVGNFRCLANLLANRSVTLEADLIDKIFGILRPVTSEFEREYLRYQIN